MATLAMLEEVRVAYHRVATGTKVTEARHADGRMVRWDAANVAELRRYINRLEEELGLPLTSWTPGPRTAARRIFF